METLVGESEEGDLQEPDRREGDADDDHHDPERGGARDVSPPGGQLLAERQALITPVRLGHFHRYEESGRRVERDRVEGGDRPTSERGEQSGSSERTDHAQALTDRFEQGVGVSEIVRTEHRDE